MNFIGSIIKEYREKKKMTRKELSEGICTEKYLYLIEKGQRSPSTEITRLFSNKIGIDLFKFHDYLSCENPTFVYQTINQFNFYRRESDLLALKKLTEDVSDQFDFCRKPYLYEIITNQLILTIILEKNYHDGICQLEKIIPQVSEDYPEVIYLIDFYTLLSTASQLNGDYNRARKALHTSEQLIRGKEYSNRFSQIYTSHKISLILLHYRMNELNEVIRESDALLQYKKHNGNLERLHYPLFYLAFAYYQLSDTSTGIDYLIRALCAIITSYKPMDMSFLSQKPIFKTMLADPGIPPELVERISLLYKLN